MADQYAKSWVSKYDDKWYVSLKLSERGLFDQCVTWAKRCGDTGVIVFRNWSSFALQMGCNVRTARKIIAKMHPICKIIIKSQSPSLILEIANYEEYQRVRTSSACKTEAKVKQKSPLKRKDHTRKEKTRETPSKLGSPAVQFWVSEYQDKIGREYINFTQADGVLIAKIVASVGLDRFKEMTTWLFTTSDPWHSTHRTPGNLLKNINDIPALMAKPPAPGPIMSAREEEEHYRRKRADSDAEMKEIFGE